jgi:hypothetical protein
MRKSLTQSDKKEKLFPSIFATIIDGTGKNSLFQLVCTFGQEEPGLLSGRAFCAQQPMGFIDSS